MKFLLQHRFSYIDITWLAAFNFLLGQGRYLTAAITFVVGVITTAALQRLSKPKSRDHEWQAFANTGDRVFAIKQHRIIYGSSLKEALDAVNAHMDAVLDRR